MSFIDVASTDLCVRAVQTLMHFLWQGLLLAVVVAVVNGLCRRRPASLRYGVSFNALLIMVVCLAVTFLLVSPSYDADADGRSLVQTHALANGRDSDDALSSAPGLVATRTVDSAHSSRVPGNAPDATGTNATSTGHSESALWRHASPYIAAFYVVGVLLMLARLLLAVGGGERLRRCSFPVNEREILDCFAAKVAELGLRVSPAIAKCERVAAPIIVGVFKPTILLPVAILSELSPSQIEAILTHELAHIRRWDHVANLVQRIIESLLFFHPVVWYVSRCVSRERENCCDDTVLATGAEATGYAELLVRVAEMTQFQRLSSAAALAASGTRPTKLRERVLRVLGATIDAPVRVTRVGFAVAAVLVGIVSVELLCLHASGPTDDTLSDFDFNDPPAAYEKEIRAADVDHRVQAGALRFKLSDLARGRDGALEASLGLRSGYEVVSFRLFDHTTRKFFHDSDWQLNPENAPSSRKFVVIRDGETDRVRIHETGGQLPETIDLWLRIVENGPGKRIVIPAKEGASVKCGDSQIVVTSLLAGSMNGKGSRSGKKIWDVENARDTDWQTTVDLENTGEVLRGRYHLVAVTKEGWRHAMDHKHFLDFSLHGRHNYVSLDVCPDVIDHLELIPFKDRHKFFFNGVDVPGEENPTGDVDSAAEVEPSQYDGDAGQGNSLVVTDSDDSETVDLPDGVYRVRPPQSTRAGVQVARNDTDDTVVLLQRLTDNFGTATMESIANDNTRFRIRLEAAGPFSKGDDIGHFALVIDGACVMVGGNSDPDEAGRMDLSAQVVGKDASTKIATRLGVEPLLRQYPGHKMAVRFLPTKKGYPTEGPVVLRMEIENVGDNRFSFCDGGRQRGARNNQFDFRAFRDRGQGPEVPDTGDPINFGGPMTLRPLCPGDAFQIEVDITKWFDLSQPGTYRINGRFDMEIKSDYVQGYQPAWDDTAKGECLVVIGQVENPSENTGETGRVVNSAGEGVGGAKLEFARCESVVGEDGKSTLRIKILAERTSRQDGSYDIPRLPGVERFQVFVFADGYYPFDRFHFNIEGFVDQQGRTRIFSGDDGLSRTIHLVRPATIEGKVIGPDGSPLAGAPLSISTYCRLEHLSCSTGNHMRAITDDDGVFRFAQVPPGQIVLYYPWDGPNKLEVRDGKWSKWTKPGQTYPSPPTEGLCWVKVFDLVESQQFDELVVDLSKSTCILEGRVTDRRGQAVKGVNVLPLWKRRDGYYSVHGMEELPAIYTDDEGRYRITGLPPGEVYVGFHSKHRKIEFEPVAVGLNVGESTHRDLRVRVNP